MVVAPLEDVARRIDRGPSKEELKYVADVLDQLSKELEPHTQSEH